MIEYKSGNILTEDAEAVVNTVNCVGIMGRGIALQFKKAFPANFKAYAAACKRGEVQPGQMFVYDIGGLTNPRYIINFPTKRHWRGKSRMADIESGLQALVAEIQHKGIRSIALPPLGSGLGGLEWSAVRKSIERRLAGCDDVHIVVYEPEGAAVADKIVRNREVPKMTSGRAALVELMRYYLAGLLDPFVTLLEVHKLMYFLQEAGEPLRLQYKKAPYGPYAQNLRPVLHAIEGHWVSGYSDGGDAPYKPLELVPGAVKDAEAFLQEHTNTRKHIEQVTQLVDGFESSFGLELLASVHWVMKHENPSSKDDVAKLIHSWNEHKKRFTHRQISMAVDVMERGGWGNIH